MGLKVGAFFGRLEGERDGPGGGLGRGRDVSGGVGGEGGDLVERGAGEGGGEIAGVDEESFEFGGLGEGLGGELVGRFLAELENGEVNVAGGRGLLQVEGEVHGLGLGGNGRCVTCRVSRWDGLARGTGCAGWGRFGLGYFVAEFGVGRIGLERDGADAGGAGGKKLEVVGLAGDEGGSGGVDDAPALPGGLLDGNGGAGKGIEPPEAVDGAGGGGAGVEFGCLARRGWWPSCRGRGADRLGGVGFLAGRGRG